MLTLKSAATSIFGIPSALCTVTAADTIVPWLAASGPNSYTPDDPPENDEGFDYGRTMPGAFKEPGEYKLGASARWNHESGITEFWNDARKGKVINNCVLHGERNDRGFKSPIAIYEYAYLGKSHYVLMQNGSYQILECRLHPEIAYGRIRLYRGVGQNNLCMQSQFPPETAILSGGVRVYDVLNTYFNLILRSYLSSEDAFRAAHSDNHRNRSEHVRMLSLTSFIPEYEKYFIGTEPMIRAAQRACHLQRYTMCEQLAKGKFGPNYATYETDLTNLRLISGFVGEGEVAVIDPRDVWVRKAHGCKIYYRNTLNEAWEDVRERSKDK